jgi:hypothetical protein
MQLGRHVAIAAIAMWGLSGCDGVRMSPQVIDADGEVYVACSGLVWAKDTSGFFSNNPVFKVSFTDSGNKSHTIWGITKLKVSEPQQEQIAAFPANLPDPKLATDVDGKSYVNGNIYTWPDGSKAQFSDGKWRPVRIAAACN